MALSIPIAEAEHLRKAVSELVALTRAIACDTYGDTAELSNGPCLRCVGMAVVSPFTSGYNDSGAKPADAAL